MRAAVLGGGVIGGGWLARLIEGGVEVAVYDPDPEAGRKLGEVLANAERAYGALYAVPRGPKGAWRLAGSVAEAVAGAELIVEAVPERLDLKHRVYAQIEAANADGIISSSTSGFTPSQLQAPLAHPGRLIVGHPFNPVYLLPLVEVVGGAATDPATVERACAIYRDLGMYPLVVRREIDAHIADRFLEAVWREALWLVSDGIATTAEIDEAIRMGFGLRWAQMGLFETYRIAGGEAGMRHFLAQFGPCLSWPWTKLMDVPELTDELVETIAAQSDAQSGARTIRELERIRDENLVAILHALKANGWGAGEVLAAQERRLLDAAAAAAPAGADGAGPLVTVSRSVPRDWADYNGHMNEGRYGQLFADAVDGLMAQAGAGPDYVARGFSFFTAETHVRFLAEAHAGDRVEVTTQVLGAEGRKLHLFHWLRGADGALLATGEQMLVHVNLATRAACPPEEPAASRLAALAAAHAALPAPDGAGRAIALRRPA